MIKKISKFISGMMMGAHLLFLSSCEELTNINMPIDELTTDAVFADSLTIRSAINGLYSYNVQLSGFGYLIPRYITVVSDDAFHNIISNAEYNENSYGPASSVIGVFWEYAYKSIYSTNSLITRLGETTVIGEQEAQLGIAQAKYFRAYCYWFLVNCFGDVPLVLSTDYKETAIQPRESTDAVYQQIVEDLIYAESVMGRSSNDNTKVTEAAAKALLARTYLYMGRWSDAEAKANDVITKYGFKLEPLSGVFLRSSKETIFKGVRDFSSYMGCTYWGYFCSIRNYGYLRPQLLDAFEQDDNRKTEWTLERTAAADKLPDGTMPIRNYKYKQATSPTDGTWAEDYVLLRLGEQYLIRAEARAQQGFLTGAIEDLNVIRKRAGLDALPDNLTKEQVLLAVEQERRIELFMEEAHRWFDLKRTDRIDFFMNMIPEKKWSPHKALFPIPEKEITRNYRLTPNPGYGNIN